MPQAAAQDAVIIRSRKDEDIPKAAAALVRVHSTDGYPVEGVDEPEAWLTPPKLIRAWVADLDGRIVGHVAISSADGEEAVSLWTDQSGEAEGAVGVLARLFVTPEARRMDLGARLTRTAMAHAQHEGLRLVLDVMAKDAAAARLYEKLGWRRIGTATHAYGDQTTNAVSYVAPPG